MFDEIQKDAIRVQAHAILQRFSEKLADVKTADVVEKPSSSGMRHNEIIKTADSDFREMIFKNAIKKDESFIYGETKKW
ncbi:MAG TPA: hypothetical protein VHA12_03725 [Candidatus Nanoarchaeia archaeon]|nr:hypothetical protein [Candidatus Nanoarchaeia archaeon]